MGKLQEEQFWESNGDQKFGLSTFEVPIRFLTGETNYSCSSLHFTDFFHMHYLINWEGTSFQTCKSPEDNISREGEFSYYVWAYLG